MIRFVLTTDLTGQVSEGVVSSIAALRAARPELRSIALPRDPAQITDEHLIAHQIAARTMVLATAPNTAELEERVEGAELQGNTWVQTWAVQDRLTLQQAKDLLIERAPRTYWQKTVVEPPTTAEIVTHSGDVLDIIAARQAVYRPLLNAARVGIPGAGSVAEVHSLWVALHDATV